MAFYDVESDTSTTSLERIADRPIAFRVWVDPEPVVTGRWAVIGHQPLEAELVEPVWFYKRDTISGAFSLYRSDSNGEEFPATREECEKLENAAIWRIIHIEARLNDHFAGRVNITLESFKRHFYEDL